MWIAMALVLGLGSHSSPWTSVTRYERGGWELRVSHDRFSGKVSCTLKTKGVSLIRDTLIFRMGRDAETADANFRIDNGPVRSVREALALDQARGFFPDRGWIEDPSESQVALPSTYARGARNMWIRANPKVAPRYFRVTGLDYMVRSARAQGCPLRPI